MCLVKVANCSWDAVTKEAMLQLGSIARGIPEHDLKNLDFSDPDIIGEFGRIGLWSFKDIEKLTVIASEVQAKFKRNIRAYTGWDFLVLGQIICGFPIEDLQKITVRSFADGITAFAHLDCPIEVMEAFELKVIEINVFDDPNLWGPGVLNAAGNLLACLCAKRLRSIPPCAFSGITPFTVKHLPPITYNTLCLEQIMAIPPESILSISPSTMDDVNTEVREALLAKQTTYEHTSMQPCLEFSWDVFEGSLSHDDGYLVFSDAHFNKPSVLRLFFSFVVAWYLADVIGVVISDRVMAIYI